MRSQVAAWLRQNEHRIVPAWIKLVRSRGSERDRQVTTKELERQFFSDFYHAFTLVVQENKLDWLLSVIDRIASSRVEQEFQLEDTLDIFYLLKDVLWSELSMAVGPEAVLAQLHVLDATFNQCSHLLAAAYTRASRDLLSDRLLEAEFMTRRLAIATEETDRALSRLRILYNISRAISSTLDLKQILSVVAENLISIAQIDRSAVWLVDKEGYELSVSIARGIDGEHLEGAFLSTADEHSVVARAYNTNKLQIVRNTEGTDETLAPLFPQRILLVVPLEGEVRPLGVVTVDSLARNRPLETAVIEMVQSVADQAAIALRNIRLYEELVLFNQELEQRVETRTEELARLNQDLAKLDRKKSDFITIAAHELKTPLTLIQGYAEMLAEGGVRGLDGPALDMVVGGIVKGSGRLRAIIEDILDVALIDTQVLMLNIEPASLLNVVEMARLDLVKAAESRRHVFTVSGFESIPPIEADALRLHQVFTNVIGNAIKYTPDAGRIDVMGRLLPGTDGRPVWVEVVVSDTGVGIDIEDQEHIFDKFYRIESPDLHSTSKTKFMGAGPGLGLTIAKGIVEAHGGRIWVESKGHDLERCPGSHFHILLPVRPAWGDFRAAEQADRAAS